MSIFADNSIGAPFIKNYLPQEYGQESQNWAVVQDHRGIMYFGNNDGLLEYDGTNWNLIETDNHSVVRSLCVDREGRVYVGARGSFGYLAITSTGSMEYVPIIKHLAESDLNFNDVWSTHATGDGIYFVTAEKIFYWNYATVSVIHVSTDLFGTTVGDRVFVPLKQGGILALSKGKTHLLPDTELFNFEKAGIILVHPFADNQLLICTDKLGFYIYSYINNTGLNPNDPVPDLERFPTEVDDYIKQNYITSVVETVDKQVAIGTKRGGIIIMDRAGKLVQVINQNRGLIESTLHFLYKDRDHNLWAAMNRGISHALIHSRISRFDNHHGLKDTVQSAIRYKGSIYTGLFNGIYYLPDHTLNIVDDQHSFVQIPDYQSYCFDLKLVGDSLLAAANRGVLLLEKQRALSVLDINRVMCFGESAKFPRNLFLGLYGGFAVVEYSKSRPAGIKLSNPVVFEMITDAIRKIVSDRHGDLWLTTELNGIIHITFPSGNLDNYQINRYSTGHGLPDSKHNFVHNINGSLLVTTKKGIYEAQQRKSSGSDVYHFVPEKSFGKLFNDPPVTVNQIILDNSNRFWISSPDLGLGYISQSSKGSYQWNDILYNIIPARSIQNVYVEPNGVVWICTVDGLLRYDAKKEKNYKTSYYSLIRSVTVNNQFHVFQGTFFDPLSGTDGHFKLESQEQPVALIPKIHHKHNSILFQFSSAFYEHNLQNRFKIKLSGYDEDWSNWTGNSEKEYTNLPPGEYLFRVVAQNIYGNESNESLYRFSITPPWSQTLLAYSIYGLLFLLFFWVLISLNSRRLIAAKKRLENTIKERTAEISQQREEIANQKEEISSQRDQLIKANEQLKELASIDGLTGLANRRKFMEVFHNEWKRSVRNRQPLAIIMADVDYFKLYNDTYGHQMGDRCLEAIAAVFRRNSNRPGDLAARYGGEEFIMVLSETDSNGAWIMAERIRNDVVILGLTHPKSAVAVHVTISLGCATGIAAAETDLTQLIQSADQALYVSKKAGRNRTTKSEL